MPFTMAKSQKIIPYDPKLTKIAKKLRKDSTLSEVLLWRHLRGKQMRGYNFHRQKPLGNYVVDFFCKDLMLAIEIDGYSHGTDETYKSDKDRQRKLDKWGVMFLRFNDLDVKKDIKNVLNAIEGWIDKHEQTYGKALP